MPRHRRVMMDDLDAMSDAESPRSERPGQRNAANARERHRMRILSKAFSELKTKLPYVPQDTKLSKLDTLRLATSYIAQLKAFLADDGSTDRVVHPINLTWPFTIQQGQNNQHEISRNSENWSPDEQIPTSSTFSRGHVNVGLMTGYLGQENSEGDSDNGQSPRIFTKNYHYSDHRHHFSDSLLNIG